MKSDILTVVTPTVGHTDWRLDIFLAELRKYTTLPFRQIVCDDGTVRDESIAKQKEVCERYGVQHLANPGPYGLGNNLNYAIDHCDSPWVYIVEDGLRPSMGWLEAAISCIQRVGNQSFCGYDVGMIGMPHIQDWLLVLANVINTRHGILEWYRQNSKVVEDFYSDWNDGYWCWPRILPNLRKACEGYTADWIEELVAVKHLLLDGSYITRYNIGGPYFTKVSSGWSTTFPDHSRAFLQWYPGGFLMVKRDILQRLGGFRSGCNFFEGHLGIRMGMNNHLSLYTDSPPWLHCPSLGFKAISDGVAKPRQSTNTEELFKSDFGCSHLDAIKLINDIIPISMQLKINEKLRDIKIDTIGEWDKYIRKI